MLNRFTGTDERKAVLASTVPLKRVGKPEEIAVAVGIPVARYPPHGSVRALTNGRVR